MREEQKNIGEFIGKYLKEEGESEYKEIIKRYEKEEGKSEEEFWKEMKKYAEEVMREKEISEDELEKIAGGVKFGDLGKKGKQMVSYLLVASSIVGQSGGMKASAAMPKQLESLIEKMGMQNTVEKIKEKGNKGIDIIKKGTNKGIEFCKEKPQIAIPVASAVLGGGTLIGGGAYLLGKKLFSGKGASKSTLSKIIGMGYSYNTYTYYPGSFKFSNGTVCRIKRGGSATSSGAAYGFAKINGDVIGDTAKKLDASMKQEIDRQWNENNGLAFVKDSQKDSYVVAVYTSGANCVKEAYANIVNVAINNGIECLVIESEGLFKNYKDNPQWDKDTVFRVLSGIEEVVKSSESAKNMQIILAGNWPELSKAPGDPGSGDPGSGGSSFGDSTDEPGPFGPNPPSGHNDLLPPNSNQPPPPPGPMLPPPTGDQPYTAAFLDQTATAIVKAKVVSAGAKINSDNMGKLTAKIAEILKEKFENKAASSFPKKLTDLQSFGGVRNRLENIIIAISNSIKAKPEDEQNLIWGAFISLDIKNESEKTICSKLGIGQNTGVNTPSGAGDPGTSKELYNEESLKKESERLVNELLDNVNLKGKLTFGDGDKAKLEAKILKALMAEYDGKLVDKSKINAFRDVVVYPALSHIAGKSDLDAKNKLLKAFLDEFEFNPKDSETSVVIGKIKDFEKQINNSVSAPKPLEEITAQAERETFVYNNLNINGKFKAGRYLKDELEVESNRALIVKAVASSKEKMFKGGNANDLIGKNKIIKERINNLLTLFVKYKYIISKVDENNKSSTFKEGERKDYIARYYTDKGLIELIPNSIDTGNFKEIESKLDEWIKEAMSKYPKAIFTKGKSISTVTQQDFNQAIGK